MDEVGGWAAFKEQLEDHYQKLAEYHRELGGEYEDSSTSLMSVLQAALEASLEATKSECDRVKEDCESMLRDMAMMRTAMGEFSKSTGTNVDDPFTTNSRSRIQAPLLESQKALRISHEHAKKEFEARASKVTARYRVLEEYVATLPAALIGISIPVIDDLNPPQDVSLVRLGQLDAAITRCAQELQRRKTLVQQLGQDIIQLWAELAIETYTLDSNLDRHILLDSQSKPEALGLMDDDLALLEQKRTDLVAAKAVRQETINALLKTIKNLHAKLRLPDHELSVFLSSVRGVAASVIEKCENELGRLNELKKDHIEDFVKDCRVTLEELWEALYLNEDQRLDFTPAFVEIYTDASLLAHELEIARLQDRLQELEPLLALLSRHMELQQEKKEFVIKTSDPARFSKRGYNPMAESKMRARIENNLPRVEQALQDALQQHEEAYGTPFLIWGEAYLETATDEGKGPQASKPAKNTRPRTPATSSSTSRPISATPHRAVEGKSLSRSVSTPVRPNANHGHKPKAVSVSLSASPQKRGTAAAAATAVGTPAMLYKLGSTARSRTELSSALKGVPASKIGLPPAKSTSRLPALEPQGTRQVNLQQPHQAKRTIPGPRSMAGKALQRSAAVPHYGSRIVTGSSTSSQVSTENWETFHPSSEEDEDVRGLHAAKPGMPTRVRLSGRMDEAGVEVDLRDVPEEPSFVDDWGDEGF